MPIPIPGILLSILYASRLAEQFFGKAPLKSLTRLAPDCMFWAVEVNVYAPFR